MTQFGAEFGEITEADIADAASSAPSNRVTSASFPFVRTALDGISEHLADATTSAHTPEVPQADLVTNHPQRGKRDRPFEQTAGTSCTFP